MKCPAIFLLIFFGVTAESRCQDSLSTDYPFLYKVETECQVTHNSKEMFFYTYTLINDKSNRGSISDFLVDISRGSNSIQYDTIGLRFDSRYEEESFREDYPPRAERLVAVGFPSLPIFWTGTLANRPVAWFGVDTLFPVPGDHLSGLMLMSRALPGIRSFEVHPYFNIYEYFPSIEDTSANAMTTTQMDSIREAVNYHGWTIGPTAPPMVFEASVWIDTLLSYTHQSVGLGWLGSGRDDDCDNDERPQVGIERNIERRLVMAQRDLQRGDSVKARRDLELLVNKVDRLWKRGQMVEKRHEHERGDWWQHRKEWVVMTSEAYALLKYNAEYLIDRLPEKESHGKKPGKEEND